MIRPIYFMMEIIGIQFKLQQFYRERPPVYVILFLNGCPSIVWYIW